MNRATIDMLWQQAMRESVEAGEMFTRYHFAAFVADAEAKRIHDEGMVTVGHMREQIAAEREACAKVCDELHWPWHMGDNSGPRECATAIRVRGQT